ncbi:MAG: methyltransferase domain-containing protein, partial [Candidatus Marinimicrobia bacterium]|nr:methyltransferase domain-containing protein [Candidatus Neomarinimicrobiota bacterium]
MGIEKPDTAILEPDWDTYAHWLYLSDFLRAPVMRSAIRALQLPSGSRGLDVGCGIGGPALLLAEAVAPEGQVTGLDLSPELLDHAKRAAEESGLSAQVSFREGDMNQIPFDDDTFDWAWS